ncbi:MAG: DUF4198 domain-containing protein [Ectothiorhodospiraceae bacterium]|nr:DUF4198 domain-containing protein [Ectothiorhodospiraceae bacterium]
MAYTGAGLAHYPWLVPESFRLQPGDSLSITPGWGHHFGDEAVLEADRIAGLRILSADGADVSISRDGDQGFHSDALTPPGVYLAAATQVRGYWSRTPAGGLRQSRRDVPDAVSCSYSGNSMKTMVRVGTPAPPVPAAPVGHVLEVVPQSDVTGLRRGDTLRVLVLFQGSPYQGPLVALSESNGETPALETETDGEGFATVPLNAGGRWMLRSHASTPYPDPEVCDTQTFAATLTFHVAVDE